MPTKRDFGQIRFDSSFTAVVPALGDADLSALRRALVDVAPDWSVELEGISPEEANLVVLPDDGDDATGPSFVISREAYGLRIDQLHWDVLTEVGLFPSMERVTATLQARLAFCGPSDRPPAITIH